MEGTFMTGVDVGYTSNISQLPEVKSSLMEKSPMPPVLKGSASKPTRINTALTKTLQPSKNESLPQLQQSKELMKQPVSGLRSSMTETNFKKPLFKKLAGVADYFERNKTADPASQKSTMKKSAAVWPQREEEGGITNHADAFNATIIDKYNALYQSRKGFQKSKDEEILAKRKHFFQEIEKQETKLQGEQKRYDTICFDIQRKEKLLKQLSNQVGDLEKRLDNTEELEQRKKDKTEELGQWEEKIEVEEHRNECLKHMKQLKKELLLNVKKRYQERKETIDLHDEGIDYCNKNKSETVLNNIDKLLGGRNNDPDRALAQVHRLIAYYEKVKTCNKHKPVFKETDTEEDRQRKIEQEKLDIKACIAKKRLLAKEMRKKAGIKDVQVLDPEFEQLLENEVSEFEEKRNMREIFRHEKVLEEELHRQEVEEERRAAQTRENKRRDEEKKRLDKQAEHQKELDLMKSRFEDLHKVTHVTHKEDLIDYFDGLEQRSATLETEIEASNEYIKGKKEELKELKKQLKFKKFEEVEVPKDHYPKDIRIDDLEVILRDKQNETGDRENNIKRLDKLSYEVCTVISRILKQLQKTKTPMPVDKSNVVDLLSICGLKLERMLTVVIKKKKTFFIESINTDGTIREGPPSYMNIVSDDVYNKSRKQYEKERPGDIGEELEDSYLSQLRTNIKYNDLMDSPL